MIFLERTKNCCHKSEELETLYLQVQSQEDHTNNHLEERGVEREALDSLP